MRARPCSSTWSTATTTTDVETSPDKAGPVRVSRPPLMRQATKGDTMNYDYYAWVCNTCVNELPRGWQATGEGMDAGFSDECCIFCGQQEVELLLIFSPEPAALF